MNIVYIGSVKFSEFFLKKLIEIDYPPVGVCTLEKSDFNSDHVDLTKTCLNHNIPSRYTPNVNSKENIRWIKSLEPDIIFCFGWSKLLKQELLNLTKYGVVGYHPAELPKNRGRHPLIWSLVLGLTKTASTFFFMEKGADSGDILSQKTVFISNDDDADSLYHKIAETGMKQIELFVSKIEKDEHIRTPQNHKLANTWRLRGEKDGEIDWRMPGEAIHSLVKGLGKPYIGAHFEFNTQKIKVWKTKVIINTEINIEPGKILDVNQGNILVKAGIDSILLMEISPRVNLEKGMYL